MRSLSLAMLTAALASVAVPLGAQERLAVRSEPGTPVVAVEVLVAAGPADEPTGKAGLAYLAARTVVAPILPLLDSLGAHLETTAAKDALTFTLIAAPDVWEDASRMLLVALFRDPPERQWMTRQQTAITAELTARASNPADAAMRATDAAVYGRNHPWGRSTVGSAESIRRLTMADVDEFLRSRVTSQRAVVAVVGPVDGATARLHLRGYFDPSSALPPQEWGPPDPAESVVRVDYNSITTWVGVSYPFRVDADLEALEFLARLTADELSFSPSRSSVFNARGEVIPRRAGGELRFQVVAPPEEAGRWADRVRELVERTASGSAMADAYPLRLRRYRGERLQDLATPEARARWLARQLLVTGRARAIDLDLDDMTIARLRGAVRALGAPTVVLLGPIIDQNASSTGD